MTSPSFYTAIGALTFVIALAFRFTALGRADDYRRATRHCGCDARGRLSEGVGHERAAACVAHVTDSARALAICSAPT
jgi:hypothetical protein